MEKEIEIFYSDGEVDNFETISVENGKRTWSARTLMEKLGYSNYATFRKVIDKGIKACMALNIEHQDDFIPSKVLIDGKEMNDYKLTRFACYFVCMNADSSLPEVAKSQAYFITYAEAMRLLLQKTNEIDRVTLRSELTEKENSLSGVVNRAGITQFPLFKNAGYRGMYNMNINELKRFKGIPLKETLYDYMGTTELAANLFRITQTEDIITNRNIKNQSALEHTAEAVGREVRNTIIRMNGTLPEHLPIEDNIKKVKSKIRITHKEFSKLDNKKRKDN